MSAEVLLMWTAVTVYTVSAILFVFGVVFKSGRVQTAALWVALAGLVPQAVAMGIRWVAVGHGPYIGFYEVISSYAFVSVVALGVISWIRPSLKIMGVLLMPMAVLMLGGAMLAPRSPLPLSAKLASYWLSIHVAFAKLSYGSFLAAFALAALFLWRERRGEPKEGSVLANLPSQATVDDLSFRFIGVGFIFLSIMIVAGAIWANEAWGRYWGWDPIETWSLICWIVYAGYLHVRLTLGWRGSRSAWYAVAALPLMAFTFVGVPIVYRSIHGAYLTGYEQSKL
jgi:cytochrome c-type biogenesis protein CcsB